MEPFKIHILGCGSATPTIQHFPSSQIIEVRGKYFMIDCAEGTQLQVRKSRVNFTKIQAVFITHMHGDHCFGLIGMISTFGFLGRTAPLHVYAPQAMGDYLAMQMKLFCTDLAYDVLFHPVDTTVNQVIYQDRSITVESIPLRHRMPCAGFLFREKPGLPHIRRDMLDFYHIPISQINNIKAGADWTTPDGEHVPNSRLVTPASPTRSYAYCSDTSYLPELHTLLHDVDVLYHEATYADDMIDNARKYYHSTARQAATVARDANVKRLLLGHYSARYEHNESLLLQQAQEVFPQTILTHELQIINV